MGSISMHLYMGELIKEKYNFSDKFLVGTVLPDVYKKSEKLSAMESHYLFSYEDKELGLLFLPDALKYLRENELDDEIKIGYFAHLVEDYCWFKFFTGRFAKPVGFSEDGSQEFIFRDEAYSKVHPESEFLQEMYDDYSFFEEELQEKIDIENVKSKVKEYLAGEDLDEAVDRIIKKYEAKEGRKNRFITRDLLDEYFEKALNMFDEYYLKYREDGFKNNIDVAIAKCDDYTEENVKNAFDEIMPLVRKFKRY